MFINAVIILKLNKNKVILKKKFKNIILFLYNKITFNLIKGVKVKFYNKIKLKLIYIYNYKKKLFKKLKNKTLNLFYYYSILLIRRLKKRKVLI